MLVGFMTIRSRGFSLSFQSVLYTSDFARKNNFRPSPLTIFVRVAKFPPHQDEGMWLLTNLLIRGKVVSLNGDVAANF